MSTANRQRGLSLVEMLVVLMIAGLVLGIVFSALFQLHRQQSSIANANRTARDLVLNVEWITEGMRGFFISKRQPFSGRGTEIQGFNLVDLSGRSPASTPQRWRLVGREDGVDLVVDSNGEASMRLALDGVRRAQFSYVGEDGGVLPAWPAEDSGSVGTPRIPVEPTLPRLIVLTLSFLDDSPTQVIVGAPHQVGRKVEFEVPVDEE